MLRQLRRAIMSVLVMAVAFGLVFPLVITAIARVAFPRQASGSLITKNGKIIGSEIIGQSFSDPRYFHPRPSAAGGGYDASNSGGTNLGPTSDKLINGTGNFDGIKDLAASYRKENGLPPDAPLPADAVTRSASGLDPHISPANAELQVARVARVRGLPEDGVRRLVNKGTEKRQLGVLGEARVNVLKLNLALDSIQRHSEQREESRPRRSDSSLPRKCRAFAFPSWRVRQRCGAVARGLMPRLRSE